MTLSTFKMSKDDHLTFSSPQTEILCLLSNYPSISLASPLVTSFSLWICLVPPWYFHFIIFIHGFDTVCSNVILGWTFHRVSLNLAITCHKHSTNFRVNWQSYRQNMRPCYVVVAHIARLMVQFLSSAPHCSACTRSHFSFANYTLTFYYNAHLLSCSIFWCVLVSFCTWNVTPLVLQVQCSSKLVSDAFVDLQRKSRLFWGPFQQDYIVTPDSIAFIHLHDFAQV